MDTRKIDFSLLSEENKQIAEQYLYQVNEMSLSQNIRFVIDYVEESTYCYYFSCGVKDPDGSAYTGEMFGGCPNFIISKITGKARSIGFRMYLIPLLDQELQRLEATFTEALSDKMRAMEVREMYQLSLKEWLEIKKHIEQEGMTRKFAEQQLMQRFYLLINRSFNIFFD